MKRQDLSYLLLLVIFTLSLSGIQAQTASSSSDHSCDSSSSIMDHFEINEISWLKVSQGYLLPDATGSSDWILRTEMADLFDSIQIILEHVPARGDVWKDWDCSEETVTLELMDGYRNKKKLYFYCGALSSPCNSAYYSDLSFKQHAEAQILIQLHGIVQSLHDKLTEANGRDYDARVDTLSIVHGDSLYYALRSFPFLMPMAHLRE